MHYRTFVALYMEDVVFEYETLLEYSTGTSTSSGRATAVWCAAESNSVGMAFMLILVMERAVRTYAP